ncbi:diacylglycerol O-acyltransferase 3-like [Magnolia sinica]|uniref:diacylglycerol O-acyltransferase 3-like n=1 Tax=Magnolia sinica TaxID=86752 RepID=UPI00265944BA|nr:diacylglycerol O-acyltransferase 3-like [Magnolia sinica]
MEVSGIAFRPLACVSGAGSRPDFETHFREPSLSGLSITGNRLSGKLSLTSGSRDSKVSIRSRKFYGGSEFSNDGHLCYYAVSPKCGGKKKEKNPEAAMIKKRLKLVKGLSRDLSAFSGMGFGLETGESLIGEVKGKTISEAAEVLLAQLQQLRSEEKEMKRKRKEEKAAMKAARMKAMAGKEDTSSSSSESSDSECGEVVDMSRLRSGVLTEANIDKPQAIQAEASITVPNVLIQEHKTAMKDTVENSSLSARGHKCGTSFSSANGVAVGTSAERIEVCMGGKCKKSGAVVLLEEFERKVGIEGAVVGCKCMGKCRDGPNVRVLNCCNDSVIGKGEDAIRPATNPLCIGVGLDNVDAIVANFFGDKKDVGLVAA